MKTVLDLIRQRVFIGAFVLSILIVVGAYFGSHWYYGDVEPVPEEMLNYKPSPAVSLGALEKRLSWTDDSATQRQSTTRNSEGKVQSADEPDNLDDLEYTPVHYFPDGTPVPEHLFCPERYVGVHMTDLSDAELQEQGEHFLKVQAEVNANYNPNRPVSELWDEFMALELQYEAEAEQAGKFGRSVAGGSIALQYEQLYKYPEILQLLDDDIDRFFNTFMVEKGSFEPDWNLYELPDGRQFRAGDGYLYEFRYTTGGTVNSEGVTRRFEQTRRFGHSGRDAPVKVIDLNETSDEELERLGGWNYNYNPYTGERIKIGFR